MRRLLCRWFGHRWTSPAPLREEPARYGVGCKRCNRVFVGSWDVMEAIGAARKYWR